MVALEAAYSVGNEYYMTYWREDLSKEEKVHCPTRRQTVPTQDPGWGPDTALRDYVHKHFQVCVL